MKNIGSRLYWYSNFVIIIMPLYSERMALFICDVKSDFGSSSKDLLSQATVFPDLVAGEHLEVLPKQASQLQERLPVRGLVRPLHMRRDKALI